MPLPLRRCNPNHSTLRSFCDAMFHRVFDHRLQDQTGYLGRIQLPRDIHTELQAARKIALSECPDTFRANSISSPSGTCCWVESCKARRRKSLSPAIMLTAASFLPSRTSPATAFSVLNRKCGSI